MNQITSIKQLLGISMRPLLIEIYKFQLRFKLRMIERNLEHIDISITNDRQAQRYLWREQMTLARELQSLNSGSRKL